MSRPKLNSNKPVFSIPAELLALKLDSKYHSPHPSPRKKTRGRCQSSQRNRAKQTKQNTRKQINRKHDELNFWPKGQTRTVFDKRIKTCEKQAKLEQLAKKNIELQNRLDSLNKQEQEKVQNDTRYLREYLEEAQNSKEILSREWKKLNSEIQRIEKMEVQKTKQELEVQKQNLNIQLKAIQKNLQKRRLVQVNPVQFKGIQNKIRELEDNQERLIEQNQLLREQIIQEQKLQVAGQDSSVQLRAHCRDTAIIKKELGLVKCLVRSIFTGEEVNLCFILGPGPISQMQGKSLPEVVEGVKFELEELKQLVTEIYAEKGKSACSVQQFSGYNKMKVVWKGVALFLLFQKVYSHYGHHSDDSHETGHSHEYHHHLEKDHSSVNQLPDGNYKQLVGWLESIGPFQAALASSSLTSLASLFCFFVIGSLSFGGKINQKIMIGLKCFAAGALLGQIVFHLVPETDFSSQQQSCLLLSGVVFFYFLDRVMTHQHDEKGGKESNAALLLIADLLHNLTDGMAIAASYNHSTLLGVSTTLAVLNHEIAHQAGDFIMYLDSGASLKRSLFYNLLTGFGNIFGCLLVKSLASYVSKYIVPIVLGNFLYITFVKLMSPLLEQHSKAGVVFQILFLLLGIGMMLVVEELGHNQF